MAINLDNAQFRQFVQFAERQANPAKSEAIARVTGGRDTLAGRTITAAENDRVHHWNNLFRRSDANATENNDARALFREAVFEMFGGEANLPEGVRTAMRLDDYDQGKPLTARRIIAVRDAILRAADGVNTGTVGRQKAESLVDGAIANFDKELAAKNQGEMFLGSGLREQLIGLVAKHGAGLTDECQKILANYLVTTEFCGCNSHPERLEETASFLAGCLKNVRSFKPGEDYRLSGLDNKLKEYLQDSIADAEKPGQSGHYDADGLSDAFKTDAGRSVFTINGQHFAKSKENAGPVADKFKEAIANPQHRKVISSVLNRGLRNIIANSQTRDDLAPTTNFKSLNLSGVMGSELMLTVPRENPSFGEKGIFGRYVPEFTLTVTGSKAKVTCNVPSALEFNHKFEFGPTGWSEMRMGNVNNCIECEFDLSDPTTAKLTSVHLGQTVEG